MAGFFYVIKMSLVVSNTEISPLYDASGIYQYNEELMDIVFASSKGSQYRYFERLSQSSKYDSKVVTLRPGYGPLSYLFEVNYEALKAGVSFHIERKRNKYKSIWLPNTFWWLYRLRAYIKFLLIYSRFRRYLEKHKPSVIAVWNGHRLPEQAIKLAAVFCGVNVLYFENGLLPNTTTCDYSGVNDASSLPRLPEFYKNYFFESDMSLDAGVTLEVRKPHKNKRYLEQKILRFLEEEYYFIPFQVGFDSQVLINSKWVRSMDELYDVLVQTIGLIEDKSVKFVVKEHPSDSSSFSKYYYEHPRILFSTDNTEQLIRNAKAVITINSTVGIESLVLNKKLIVLGEACYKIPGLVCIAGDRATLVSVINEMDDWCIDEIVRKGYLLYLAREYCLPTAWQKLSKIYDEEHILRLDQKIHSVIWGIGHNRSAKVA